MATLDDLYNQWQKDQSDFRRIYYWDNGLSDGSGGWNSIYNSKESGTPLRGQWRRDEGANRFRGYQVKGDPRGGLDFRSNPLLHETGYDFLDLSNVPGVADLNFAGDIEKALEYGDGCLLIQDPRCADGGAMAGVFIQPLNSARLNPGGASTYLLYVSWRR